MQSSKERRPAIRTLRGGAISVLQEAGAIHECKEPGWMQDRAHPATACQCVRPFVDAASDRNQRANSSGSLGASETTRIKVDIDRRVRDARFVPTLSKTSLASSRFSRHARSTATNPLEPVNGEIKRRERAANHGALWRRQTSRVCHRTECHLGFRAARADQDGYPS